MQHVQVTASHRVVRKCQELLCPRDINLRHRVFTLHWDTEPSMAKRKVVFKDVVFKIYLICSKKPGYPSKVLFKGTICIIGVGTLSRLSSPQQRLYRQACFFGSLWFHYYTVELVEVNAALNNVRINYV